MRTAINAAIISARRILLVQKNETWILPGGKPEEGEEDSACLGREFGEELSGTQLENLSYYGEFEGRTPHTGDVLAAKVYFADIKGELGRPSRVADPFSCKTDLIMWRLGFPPEYVSLFEMPETVDSVIPSRYIARAA